VVGQRPEEIGCEIVGEAENASAALELFRTPRPQLVRRDLTDAGDRGSGRQVTISLDSRRFAKKHQEAAVVVISAQPKTGEQAEYMGNGALANFQKPVNFALLVNKLNQIFPESVFAAVAA
jgi:DNA-binding NarL/FixJ family response regulator